MKAAAAIGHHPDWRQALAEAVGQMPELAGGEAADVAFLFASSEFAEDYPQLLAKTAQVTRARFLIGCSSQGVIGVGQELEGAPALSLLLLWLPGAILHLAHITQADLQVCEKPAHWHHSTGASPAEVNVWFLFADPFTLDAEGLLAALSQAYPGTPLAGGLASGDRRWQKTYLFLQDGVYEEGAVGLTLGGQPIATINQQFKIIGDIWEIQCLNVPQTFDRRVFLGGVLLMGMIERARK